MPSRRASILLGTWPFVALTALVLCLMGLLGRSLAAFGGLLFGVAFFTTVRGWRARVTLRMPGYWTEPRIWSLIAGGTGMLLISLAAMWTAHPETATLETVTEVALVVALSPYGLGTVIGWVERLWGR